MEFPAEKTSKDSLILFEIHINLKQDVIQQSQKSLSIH